MVVTRFAPSPTGFLHIGGARTALFNWLYARHCGGKFLLRIEDTDRQRSTDEAVAAIYAGMKWLGLDWDGDAISQFDRKERHAEVAQQLLESGNAYHCYCTPEELAEMREAAVKEGRPSLYDGRWRERDPSEAPAGVDPVIRLKAQKDGETKINDLIQGEVTVGHDQIDDMVLLRSDGTPTYMLAVVVDDHDMGVTHVIRGDDHLTNTFRQIQIYKAMGWDIPEMAHMPLLHGDDGKKLSKRHGALGVEAYRDMGFLPEALNNYLLRLGWSHGDEEIISREQATEWFEVADVGRGAARFDMDKLTNLNGHYIRECDNARLTALVMEYLRAEPEIVLSDEAEHRLLNGMTELKDRAKNILELSDNAKIYAIEQPLSFDQKALKLLDETGLGVVEMMRSRLADLPNWTKETVEEAARTAAAEKDLGFGKIAQPLRSALCGTTVSPGIFDVLYVLGRDESLSRLQDALEMDRGSE
ncbi:MAG: glutamate--tRNA ligase [Rhodospirillaceae bacterium]